MISWHNAGREHVIVETSHGLSLSVNNEKKSKYLTANTKSWAKTKHVFVSTLFCRSNTLNRAFITKTKSGELGFRNRKSTRDDLLLTDFGVRSPGEWRMYCACPRLATLSEVVAHHVISTLMTPGFTAHSSFMIKRLQCKQLSLV